MWVTGAPGNSTGIVLIELYDADGLRQFRPLLAEGAFDDVDIAISQVPGSLVISGSSDGDVFLGGPPGALLYQYLPAAPAPHRRPSPPHVPATGTLGERRRPLDPQLVQVMCTSDLADPQIQVSEDQVAGVYATHAEDLGLR